MFEWKVNPDLLQRKQKFNLAAMNSLWSNWSIFLFQKILLPVLWLLLTHLWFLFPKNSCYLALIWSGADNSANCLPEMPHLQSFTPYRPNFYFSNKLTLNGSQVPRRICFLKRIYCIKIIKNFFLWKEHLVFLRQCGKIAVYA